MVAHFPLKRAKKKLHLVCAPVLVFSVELTCGSLGITICTQDYSPPSALRATCCFYRCISNMIWQHKTKRWNGNFGFPAGGIWNRIQSACRDSVSGACRCDSLCLQHPSKEIWYRKKGTFQRYQPFILLCEPPDTVGTTSTIYYKCSSYHLYLLAFYL